MLHITFNSIKAKSACKPGYDRLAVALGGDAEYGMDKPISLIRCLETNDVEDVIWALRATLEDSRAISVAFARKCADSVEHLKNARDAAHPYAADDATRAAAYADDAAGAVRAGGGCGVAARACAAAAAAAAAVRAATYDYAVRAYDYDAAYDAADARAAEHEKQKGFLIELLTKGE